MVFKFIARTFKLGKYKYFKGYDLDGNMYFERPNPLGGETDFRPKPQRTIQYRIKKHLGDYQPHDVPPQWSAWMRHTRLQPPTLQELQVDLARQQRLQQNVLLLEQAYGEEKRRRAEQERLAPPTSDRESQSLPSPSETEPIDTPSSHTVPGTSDPLSKTEDRPGSQDPQARGRHAGFRDLKEVPQDAEADRKRREMRKSPLEAFLPKGNPDEKFQPQPWDAVPLRRRQTTDR